MEEILASIRRIISEDETPAAEGEAAVEAEPEAMAEAAPEPIVEAEDKPEPAPAVVDLTPVAAPAKPEISAEPDADEDVLDLTEPVLSSADETIGDLDVFTSTPKAETPAMPAAAPAPITEHEPLIGAASAAATVSAFAGLAQRVAMPAPGQMLDDVVRELLRPLLKEWLDQNLAGIVQAKVDEEVERLARRHSV